MEAYLTHQKDWERTQGTGLLPVHSSGEAQRLVTTPGVLGPYPYQLVYRIIRRSVLNITPNAPAGNSSFPNNPAYMGPLPGAPGGNPPYQNNPPFAGNMPGGNRT